MNNLLLSYKAYLEDTLSKNTALSYMGDLMRFIKEINLRSTLDLGRINEKTIVEYVNFLKNQGMAYSSVARTVASLKRFMLYCKEKGYIQKDINLKIDIPSPNRKLPGTLSEAEVVRILEAPDTKTFKGIRDKAMLEIMYATGAKVSEIVNIKINDVSLKNEMIIISDGKKQRFIPLGREAIDAATKYLKDCRKHLISNQSSDFMFLNFYGQPLTRQGFWKIVKRYIKDAGIPANVTAQTLRHSFALHLLKNGADAQSVSEMLGYSDVSSTKVYIDIMNNKIKEVYKNTHPRA